MTKVESLSDEHWCTSEDVRDHLTIPDKGAERDFEQAIEGATNSIQSWYKQETGNTTLPDAGSLDDLLVEATAWLAVSEASFSYARNFSGGSDNGGDTGRTRTAEDKAHKKFNEWADEQDVASSESATEGETTDAKPHHGSLTSDLI